MPTGYTAAIKDGISFKKFIMDCARAFGACVEMREDPMDKPIPDQFDPSDYHTKRVDEAEKELTRYSQMSTDEAEQEASKEYYQNRKNYEKNIRENNELLGKYESMLDKAKAWMPPTAEHVGIKNFMIEQIEGSIKFDCMGDYYKRELKSLKRLTGQQWRLNRIEGITHDIRYHAEHAEEDKARAKARTEWVKVLRESLNGEKE